MSKASRMFVGLNVESMDYLRFLESTKRLTIPSETLSALDVKVREVLDNQNRIFYMNAFREVHEYVGTESLTGYNINGCAGFVYTDSIGIDHVRWTGIVAVGLTGGDHKTRKSLCKRIDVLFAALADENTRAYMKE